MGHPLFLVIAVQMPRWLAECRIGAAANHNTILLIPSKVLTCEITGSVLAGRVQTSGSGGGGRERPERTGAATGEALDLAAGPGRPEMRV